MYQSWFYLEFVLETEVQSVVDIAVRRSFGNDSHCMIHRWRTTVSARLNDSCGRHMINFSITVSWDVCTTRYTSTVTYIYKIKIPLDRGKVRRCKAFVPWEKQERDGGTHMPSLRHYDALFSPDRWLPLSLPVPSPPPPTKSSSSSSSSTVTQSISMASSSRASSSMARRL